MSIRVFKSTAFAPISPSRTRIAGYYYQAFPVDKTTFIPVPIAAIGPCVSQSGSGTLCGFSEYAGFLSVPPKKYRTQTISGQMKDCYGGGGSPCSGTAMASVTLWTWLGQYLYSKANCGQTNGQIQNTYQDPGSPLCSTTPSTFNSSASIPAAATVIGGIEGLAPTSSIHKETALRGPSCVNLGGNHARFGQAFADLSDEDTIADAAARATSTPGVACIATTTDRGAGVFTFTFITVEFEIDLTRLVIGKQYIVTANLEQQDYAGGNPVDSVRTYTFTATGPTNTINDSLVANTGKQLRLVSAIINFA